MQFELAPKFVCFFYGDGKEEVFLVPEILINRPSGDTSLLSNFGNTCSFEVFLAEDLNTCLDDGFSFDDFLDILGDCFTWIQTHVQTHSIASETFFLRR